MVELKIESLQEASLYVSPLAEITTLGDDKIAMSVVGRRFTVDDKAGILRGILAQAAHGARIAELADALADSFPPEAVTVAVEALVKARVLVGRDARSQGDATHEHLAYRRELSGLIQPAESPEYERANWSVLLAGAGACAEAMAGALAQLEVPLQRLAPGAALPELRAQRALLLVCADYEDFAAFRAINAQAVEQGIAALYLGIDWSTVQCGPLVLPKATACYECYYHRVRGSRKFVAEFDARTVPGNILFHALPSKLAVQFGVAEAARVALQYLSGTLESPHLSVFSEIDSQSGEIRRSRILRLPRCKYCGSASTARPVGSVFQQALLRRRA